MSVWSTKSFTIDRNYIVVRHKLRGINYSVKGLKFREGYAVIEKDSKLYYELKKMPMLRDMEEFPLAHLRKLKFITRSTDVRTIYGQDVYIRYLTAVEQAVEEESTEIKAQEEKIHLEDSNKCKFRSEQTNELCEIPYLAGSPSQYCKRHILLDPKLPELGYKVPQFLTKKEKSELRDKISEKLRGKNG